MVMETLLFVIMLSAGIGIGWIAHQAYDKIRIKRIASQMSKRDFLDLTDKVRKKAKASWRS